MELFKLLGIIAIENKEANDAIKETTDKAEDVADGLNKTDSAAKNLSSGGFTILKGAVANLISSGFQKLVSSIGNLISSGIDYQRQLEQYTTSFEVMTGSAEKAAEVTQRLQKIGAETPFELNDLANATQLLMNYGFTADDAVEKMTMLGDISQGNADKMNRIAMAYGQMSSAGKVQLEDIKQMIEAGFNPLQEISESTGESMASLYNRISKGTISIDEITAAMVRSTAEGGKYYKSMDAQSQTLAGRLSTLKDTANESIGNILGGLLQKAADEWLPAFTEAISTVDEKFMEMAQWVEENKTLLSAIAVVIGVVTTALGLQAAAQALKTAMNTAEVTSIGALIAAKWADAAASMAALAPYALIAAAIAAIIAVIVLCVKHWDQIKNTVLNVANAISKKVTEMVTSVKLWFTNMWTSLTTIVGNIVTGLTTAFTNIKNFIVDVFTAVSTFISDIWNGIWDTIKGVINKILGGVESWINGIIRAINKLIDGLNTMIEKANELLGFNWGSIGRIGYVSLPRLENGGVLERGQVGLLEGTGAEAVVPLDQNRKWISAVAKDMEMATGGGNSQQMNRVIELLEQLLDTMPDTMQEAFASMKFDVNNREFARLVKAVN